MVQNKEALRAAVVPAAPSADFWISVGVACRYFALLTAWVATCGSLFMSEVLRWTPCIMCWYQRILMYPLALLLAIGILRRDERLHQYVLPFSILGIGVSLYHVLLTRTTWLPPPPCTDGVPCNVDYLNAFGFITIPSLALTAFSMITVFSLVSARNLADMSLAVPDDEDAPAFSGSDVLVFAIIGIVVLTFVVTGRLA